MRSFIEDFFYGNIDPQARCYPPEGKAHKLVHTISELEDRLTVSFSAEEQQLFDQFKDASLELGSISELDAFTIGFRLGARMAIDTFCTDDAPFRNI